MKCIWCQNEIMMGESFCRLCGKPVSASAANVVNPAGSQVFDMFPKTVAVRHADFDNPDYKPNQSEPLAPPPQPIVPPQPSIPKTVQSQSAPVPQQPQAVPAPQPQRAPQQPPIQKLSAPVPAPQPAPQPAPVAQPAPAPIAQPVSQPVAHPAPAPQPAPQPQPAPAPQPMPYQAAPVPQQPAPITQQPAPVPQQPAAQPQAFGQQPMSQPQPQPQQPMPQPGFAQQPPQPGFAVAPMVPNQQYPMAYQPYGYMAKPKKGAAIAGLVFGILSMLFFFITAGLDTTHYSVSETKDSCTAWIFMFWFSLVMLLLSWIFIIVSIVKKNISPVLVTAIVFASIALIVFFICVGNYSDVQDRLDAANQYSRYYDWTY
ncbi:MAG: hypothetical protein J6Y58_05790 [Clostridiales bacterium]|nr:hypothetical protein [Clostridiales bacterium]